MSSPFSAPPRLLGVRLNDVSTTQRHELGTVITGVDGGVYRYVLAAELLPAYVPVDFTAAFSASVCDANDYILGVPQVAIASGSYGWILEHGVGVLMVTGSLAAGGISDISAAGALGSTVIETVAGAGTRAITYAAEAATPAGVSAFLF